MRRAFAILALSAAALAGPLHAQTLSARAADIRIGGRLHSQYAASSVESVDNDFFIRRARVTLDVTVNDFFDARVMPDFAGGRTALQDVYVRFNFSDGVRLSMGQFKRSFDLFEDASSTDLSIIERDARVAGVGGCTGVGGVCSFSRLSERLEFAGRDQGLRLEGSSGRVEYQATVTNGTGINTSDENDARSFSGRLAVAAADMLTVGGAFGVHDYVQPDEDNGYASAWTVDVAYGTWRDGLHVQAAAVVGDNWQALDPDGDEATFLAFQGVGSWFFPMTQGRLTAVEPLIRLSLADPDGDADDDAAVIFTPGVMFYVGGKNKVGFNLDVYSPNQGDTEYSFKVQSFLYF